jgi:hypothetical protein
MNDRRLQVRQTGVALLLMLLMVIIFAAIFTVYSARETHLSAQNANREQTMRSLAAAKRILLEHAITDAIKLNGETEAATPRLGELSCPDSNNDGVTAGCPNVGWFPWETLEAGDLRDSNGERLWYFIAEDFQDDGVSEPKINSTTAANGSLGFLRVIDAAGVELRAAAIIVAPGEALPGQTRTPVDTVGMNATAVIANYLEGENAETGGGYDNLFHNFTTATQNDQMIVITVDELMEQLSAIALREAAAVMKRYYEDNHFYPYMELDYYAACDTDSDSLQRTIGFLPVKAHQSSIDWQVDANEPNPYPGPCPYTKSLTQAELGSYGLQKWFTQQDWHKYIFGIIAPACTFDGCTKSGGVCSGCDSMGSFLSLTDAAGTTTGIQAMVVHVGPQLSDNISCNLGGSYTQSRVDYPYANYERLCDYLESVTNTDNDTSYVQQTLSTVANDEFLIVNP